MKKVLGIFLNAFLLFTLSFLCIGGAVGFTAYRAAIVTLEQGQSITSSRGRELGVALAAMAGENFNSNPGLVKLSATMKEVVRTSKSRGDYFEIQEIGLLDGRGNLLAHNDVARLAKQADKVFQGEKYEKVMNLLKRSPVLTDTLETAPIENPYAEFLNRFLPRKLTTVKYHMGFAVFQVDDTTATGRLHMIVTVRGPKAFLPAMERLFIPAVIATAAASLALTIFALILLLIYGSISAKSARRAAGGGKATGKPTGETVAPAAVRSAPTEVAQPAPPAAPANPAPVAAAAPEQPAPAVRVYQSAPPKETAGGGDGRVLDAIPLDE